MAYIPNPTWINGAGGGTPIDAAKLNRLEVGTAAAAVRVVVNVRDYGATGDGATDDLASINSAIATLQPGGTLLFPAGYTFKTSDTVLVRRIPGVVIDLRGATISCTASGSTSRVLSVESCVSATVLGGTLKHANTGTRQNDADGLAIRRSTDVLVLGVHVTSVYSIGIRIAGSQRVTIRDCTVRDTLADGIGIYGAVTDATGGAITSGSASLTCATAYFTEADIGAFVQVSGAGAAGAALVTTITAITGTNTVTLAATASTTVASAAVKVARHSERVVISGNHCLNTADDAISSVGYLTLGGIPAAPNKSVIVQGNTVRLSGARGILLTGQTRGVIADNIVDTTVNAGIYVTTESSAGGSFGSQDVEVHGNILIGCNTDYPTSNYGSIFVGSGVDAYPVTAVSVHGNTVRGGGSYYIGIGNDSGANTAISTTEIDVRGNHCLGGNGANAGINGIKTTNLSVVGNRVDSAFAAGISLDATVTGVVLVADNNVTNWNVGAGGFTSVSVGATGAAVDRNLIAGALTGAPQYVAPPAAMWATSGGATAWWGVNGALLHRFTVARPTVMRYANLYIGTASGNIQVGVLKLSPTNLLAWTAKVMDSGVIACPTAGAVRLDLGARTLDPGEYAMFFWADNTTVALFHHSGTTASTAARLAMSGTYSGGLTGSGAGAFTNRYVAGLTLENV